MKSETQVPNGWEVVRLDHVAEIQKGVSFTSDDLVPGSVPVIAGGREPAYYHHIANRPGETITVSASGANAGFVAFHETPIFATDCTTVRARPADSETRFIYYALKHSEGVLYRRRSGSAQPHVYPRDIGSSRVPLPPLNQQRAIAAVLDSIDDAIERTDAVIAATERLRDALLHELLTRGVPGWHSEWKEAPGIGTVPACWEVVRLGDVCTPPEYGASASARPFDPELPRYVRITDLTDDGRLRTEDARSANPSQVKGYELAPDDLLFARSGATVGKTYLYRSKDGPCVYAGYLIRFRPVPSLAAPKYLGLWTHSETYQRWVASMFRAGAQPNINAREYSSMRVPLPPLDEQGTVVAALDGIDDTLDRSRTERDRLHSLKSSASNALLTGHVRVSV